MCAMISTEDLIPIKLPLRTFNWFSLRTKLL